MIGRINSPHHTRQAGAAADIEMRAFAPLQDGQRWYHREAVQQV